MALNWKGFLRKVQRASPALGVFAAGVAVSVLVWAIAMNRIEEGAAARIDNAIADASEAIQARLRNTHDVLYGVQGLFRASGEVTREEFHRFVRGLKLPARH